MVLQHPATWSLMNVRPKLLVKMSKVTFASLQTQAEAEACARMMADSEPWLTLQRGYADLFKTVQNPAREIYMAKVEGEIAGLVMINMQGAFTGYIQTICVAPKWRSQGIGRQLMAFAEDRIFAETPNVFLCVSSFNTGAQNFYADLGYEVVGELRDYLVAGFSEILLRKTVAPLVGYEARPFVQKMSARHGPGKRTRCFASLSMTSPLAATRSNKEVTA